MRNTNRDWQVIAEIAPYYGVLVHDKYLNPTAEALAEFLATGANDVKAALATIRTQFGAFNPKSALDFGCGPGCHLIPLARETGDAYGVDVSDRMLELAGHHISEAGVNAVVGKDLPNRTFDWVNSSIVLQHIAPRRGYEVLRKLWQMINPGGVIGVHLTICHSSGGTAELTRDLTRYGYDGERVINYMDASEAAVGNRHHVDRISHHQRNPDDQGCGAAFVACRALACRSGH